MTVVPAGDTRYPNLKELVKYHPYHISTFADHANVSLELFQAVLSENEALTKTEIARICRLVHVPYTLLSLDHLVYIDRSRYRHRKMMEGLHKELYEIWEYQKAGSKEADRYMELRIGRHQFVNLHLNFINGWPVTYCRYLGVKAQMDQSLSFAQHEIERQIPRGLTKTANGGGV